MAKPNPEAAKKHGILFRGARFLLWNTPKFFAWDIPKAIIQDTYYRKNPEKIKELKKQRGRLLTVTKFIGWDVPGKLLRKIRDIDASLAAKYTPVLEKQITEKKLIEETWKPPRQIKKILRINLMKAKTISRAYRITKLVFLSPATNNLFTRETEIRLSKLIKNELMPRLDAGKKPKKIFEEMVKIIREGRSLEDLNEADKHIINLTKGFLQNSVIYDEQTHDYRWSPQGINALNRELQIAETVSSIARLNKQYSANDARIRAHLTSYVADDVADEALRRFKRQHPSSQLPT